MLHNISFLDYAILQAIASKIKNKLLSAELEKYETTLESYVVNRVYEKEFRYVLPLDKEMPIPFHDEGRFIGKLKFLAEKSIGEVEVEFSDTSQLNQV